MYLCILGTYLEKGKYKSLNKILLQNVAHRFMSRDGVVGVAIHNELENRTLWEGARVTKHIQTGPGADPATCTMGKKAIP
jgi:hypothetical protein